jgi:hypothetical protein
LASAAVVVSVNHRQLGLDRVTASVWWGTRGRLCALSFELGPDPPMAEGPERLSDMERASGALWSDD